MDKIDDVEITHLPPGNINSAVLPEGWIEEEKTNCSYSKGNFVEVFKAWKPDEVKDAKVGRIRKRGGRRFFEDSIHENTKVSGMMRFVYL